MNTLLQLQVYIISVSMLLVILIKIIIDKDYESFPNKLFAYTICSTLCILVSEAVGWTFDGRSGMYARAIVTISDMIEIALSIIPMMLWIIYVDYIIHNRKHRAKKIAVFFIIPIVYFLVFTVTAPFNHLFFYIDSSNKYHRGIWFWQVQCIYFMFFTYAMVLLFWNRNKINRKDFVPMVIFPIPPAIGLVLQMMIYGLSMAWNLASISILTIYIYIQNKKSSIDYLTGLFNRRQLDIYLKSVVKENKNNGLFAILMIDVNDFKTINDTWGHDMGDRAIKHCAKILKECFHYKDFIARYAGDEFVVVLELNERADIHRIISRLENTVENVRNTGNPPYMLGFSIGYAIFPDDGQDTEKILKVADKRMYDEKGKIKFQDQLA